MWEGTSIYASEEDDELGCGDGAEVECGVRGDTPSMSIGRGDMSEVFRAAV